MTRLADEGIQVSAYQLERWRAMGVIPRNRRRGLGRGRGTLAEVSAETIDAVRFAARTMRQGRAWFWRDPLVRLAIGQDVPGDEAREALLDELNRWAERLAATGGADIESEDARFAAAERLASHVRHVPDLGGLLAVARGDDVPEVPAAQARLAARVSAEVLASGIDSIDPEEVIRASQVWLELTDESVEDLLAELRQQQLAGATSILDGIPAPSVADLQQLVASAPLDDLRRAATATFHATICGQMLALMTPIAPAIATELFDDPVWQTNCRFVGLNTTRREIHTLVAIGGLANLARGLDWLERVECFAEAAQAELHKALAHVPDDGASARRLVDASRGC
jgi:hypothetical protein